MDKLKQVQKFAKLGLKYRPLAQLCQNGCVNNLEYKISQTEQEIVVDFVQTIQRSGVVTDKILRRYFLPADFQYFDINAQNLRQYLENLFKIQSHLRYRQSAPVNFNFEAIAGLADAVNTLQISQVPQPNLSRSRLPVMVLANKQDFSAVFKDFGRFGTNIVNEVFKRIVQGVAPISSKQRKNLDKNPREMVSSR